LGISGAAAQKKKKVAGILGRSSRIYRETTWETRRKSSDG
jgi:hypothetical protein